MNVSKCTDAMPESQRMPCLVPTEKYGRFPKMADRSFLARFQGKVVQRLDNGAVSIVTSMPPSPQTTDNAERSKPKNRKLHASSGATRQRPSDFALEKREFVDAEASGANHVNLRLNDLFSSDCLFCFVLNRTGLNVLFRRFPPILR
jgi:hypothetical protein